jgi:glycosyltransferase involved in cell wall biosynthesis
VRHKIIIVIPCYNDQSTVGAIVEGISAISRELAVLIIDDGSEQPVSEFLPLSSSAICIRHTTNKGYSEAIRTGVSYAEMANFEWLVTIDADGQHNIEDLKAVINLCDDHLWLIHCPRRQLQRLGEVIANFVFRYFFGFKDPLSGLKAMRIPKIPNHCSWEWDHLNCIPLLYAMKYASSEIKSYPINTLPRSGRSTFGSGIRTELKVLKWLFKALRFYRRV